MSGGSGNDHRGKGLNQPVEEFVDLEALGAASNTGGVDEHGYINDIFKGFGEELHVRGDRGLQQQPNPPVGDDMFRNNEYVPLPPNAPPSPLQYSPQSVVDSVSSSNFPVELNRASDLLMAVSVGADANKSRIFDLAYSAMDELSRKAQDGPPLWQRLGRDGVETLNESEYIREFRALDASLHVLMRMVETGYLFDLDEFNREFTFGTGNQNPSFQRKPRPDLLVTHASRQVGFVGVSPIILAEWLMDSNQWSSMFSNIVSGAILIGVLSTGSQPRNCSDTLQVMRAEFHMSTPQVPVRDCQFARYCKQLSPKTWGIVDVTLEELFPYPTVSFRRRPSGCFIEELPNGCSKITWVEHVEVQNQYVHPIFRSLVQSGFAFSAKRWVATLIRHCDWVAALMSTSCPPIAGGAMLRNGKDSLLRLAEKMTRNFCVDNSASGNNSWFPLPVNDSQDYLAMKKTVSSFTGASTETVVFTTSIWIPSPPKLVFDFLQRHESRKKWDIHARGHETGEISRIIKGQNPDNRVSIIQVVNTSEMKVFIALLQESYYDPTGSYVVYAPVDVPTMTSLLSGGNADIVSVIPSGFVIHPDKHVKNGNEANVGSVVSIMFNIIDDLAWRGCPYDPNKTMHKILKDTAFNIRADVMSLAMEREKIQKEFGKYRNYKPSF